MHAQPPKSATPNDEGPCYYIYISLAVLEIGMFCDLHPLILESSSCRVSRVESMRVAG